MESDTTCTEAPSPECHGSTSRYLLLAHDRLLPPALVAAHQLRGVQLRRGKAAQPGDAWLAEVCIVGGVPAGSVGEECVQLAANVVSAEAVYEEVCGRQLLSSKEVVRHASHLTRLVHQRVADCAVQVLRGHAQPRVAALPAVYPGIRRAGGEPVARGGTVEHPENSHTRAGDKALYELVEHAVAAREAEEEQQEQSRQACRRTATTSRHRMGVQLLSKTAPDRMQ